MIDLTQLAPEQLSGVQFARQTANEPIILANAIEGAVQQRLFTDQSYAEMIFRSVCESYFSGLLTAKKAARTDRIDSLTKQEQQALDTQLQLPAIIKP